MKALSRQLFDNKTFKGNLSYEEVGNKVYLVVRVECKKRITDEVINLVGNFFKNLFDGDKDGE